jgi:flagellar motility protein MotE (MotC chaperone)
MQRLVFFALRPLALVFAVVAALLASAPAAHAQQPVTPPLTTKRLERLLRVYVAPTPAEEAAIDELHETYLARFRAEIKPELESLPGLFGGALPAREDFENALRELDRVHAKIAEIEKGFFDEATALLAEERRAGMQRVRESRERQRNVTGPSSHVFQNVDGRGVFVDLADLLARDEFIREVPEAARKDFDAFLLAQEQRLLAQSRSFASECRKAHEQWYEAIVEQNQLGGHGRRGRGRGRGGAGAGQEPARRASQATGGGECEERKPRRPPQRRGEPRGRAAARDDPAGTLGPPLAGRRRAPVDANHGPPSRPWRDGPSARLPR